MRVFWALLFYYFLLPVKGDGGCRDLKYLKCIENKTLTGHVISTIKMMTPALQLCQSQCFREHKCVSYNLGPVIGRTRSCELNDADHSTRPGSLVSKPGYEYCPIQNPCLSSPCPVGKFCTPDLYWNTYTCEDCQNSPVPLGMEDGQIPDDNITASSFWRNLSMYKPSCGRLNLKSDLGDCEGEAWAANKKIAGEYIQVDLGIIKVITMVATQGRPPIKDHQQWATKYSLSYSLDGKHWKDYDEHGVKIFPGNSDGTTVVTNKLEKPIKTRLIRLVVKEFHQHISLRMELYGC